MSERTDEVTDGPEPRSTDDLLEETDRLLSDAGSGPESPGSADRDRAPADVDGAADAATTDADTGSGWRSRLGAVVPRPSLERLFSPRGFLAVLLVLTAGLLVGATAVPVAGRPIGVFAAAFALGLVASTRRYLEVIAAGGAVGGVAAVAASPFFAMAGSGGTVATVGAGAGLAAATLGYYLGRDLRDGLSRDVG